MRICVLIECCLRLISSLDAKHSTANRGRIVVGLALLAPLSAFAYVDPGSGLLLWQGLIAAIGAMLVFVRNPVKTATDWLKRLLGK